MSEPVLSAAAWEHARRSPGLFAVITLEGGNNAELGIDSDTPDDPTDEAAEFARRETVQALAAIAVLNDSLPDDHPAKITRARIRDIRETAHLALDEIRREYGPVRFTWGNVPRRLAAMTARALDHAAALETLLPPET